MPSVVMNDGTLSQLVTAPLKTPTAIPMRNMTAMTHQVLAGSPPMSMELPSTTSVISDPTDRSKPPETMTNNWPAARMAAGAARIRNDMMPGTVAKRGLRKLIQTQIARRTTKMGGRRRKTSHHRRPAAPRVGSWAVVGCASLIWSTAPHPVN